jgi:hypothetical protein
MTFHCFGKAARSSRQAAALPSSMMNVPRFISAAMPGFN